MRGRVALSKPAASLSETSLRDLPMKPLLLAALALTLVACSNRNAEIHACEKAADDWLSEKKSEMAVAHKKEHVEISEMTEDFLKQMGVTRRRMLELALDANSKEIAKVEAQHIIRLKNCGSK